MSETYEPTAKEADYIERQARYCPNCRADHIRRDFGDPHVMREPDAVPSVKVFCYCARCARAWFEIYALACVSF